VASHGILCGQELHETELASWTSSSSSRTRCYPGFSLTALQMPITVKALRPNPAGGPAESVTMQLTPRRNWGGRGLLGCHLLPL
jgi:hypothetical protein